MMSTTPRTPVQLKEDAPEDIGRDILTASPSSSDFRSVRFQNPLLFMCEDGVLPKHNKMEPPPRTGNYAELAKAMGYAVGEGKQMWAHVLSALGPGVGKELNNRPVLLATIAAMFVCIPPDGYRVEASDNVDVLVFDGDEVVKKALSRQYQTGRFAHEAPTKKRRKAEPKPPVVRYKTDIVVQALSMNGTWVDRLSIEHKGPSGHQNDRWESLSAACRTMKKGIKVGSLEPRHYALLWAERAVRYHVVDAFGLVDVKDGEITDDAYNDFLQHYNAARKFMGSGFPSDSVEQWIRGVDALCGATPTAWMQEVKEDDPFGRSRVRWFLAHQQGALRKEYNCMVTDGKYLIGTSYFQTEEKDALATGRISFDAAVWLTVSVLRIVLGDRVLDWKYDDVLSVMEARRHAVLKAAAAKLRWDLNDDVNVFDVESMGSTSTKAAKEIGGGWKVVETADEWIVNFYWELWYSKGESVTLRRKAGRTWLQICEGAKLRGVPRTVEVNFPEDVLSLRRVHDDEGKYDLTLVCTKVQTTKGVADWCETPEAHVLEADLPGLEKSDVKIQLEDKRVLQISGEHKEESKKGDKWERAYGSFLRRFRLPEDSNVDAIGAKVDHGVLTVTIPKIAPAGKSNTMAIDVQ